MARSAPVWSAVFWWSTGLKKRNFYLKMFNYTFRLFQLIRRIWYNSKNLCRRVDNNTRVCKNSTTLDSDLIIL